MMSKLSLYGSKSRTRLLIIILMKSILASVSGGDWTSLSFSSDGVLDGFVCAGVLGVGGRLGGPLDVVGFGDMGTWPIFMGCEIEALPLPNVVDLGLIPGPIG